MKEFYEAIDNCNPNANNRTFTVIRGEGYGEKAVLSGDRFVWLSDGRGFLAACRKELSAFQETGVFELAGASVYAELIGTEKEVVICGAGHVSMPVIRIAKMIGCRVTVIDDRPVFAGE